MTIQLKDFISLISELETGKNLAADEDGRYRAALISDLEKSRAAIRRKLAGGLTPEHYAAVQTFKEAIEAALQYLGNSPIIKSSNRQPGRSVAPDKPESLAGGKQSPVKPCHM